jgi:hypothetical protein
VPLASTSRGDDEPPDGVKNDFDLGVVALILSFQIVELLQDVFVG